MKKTTIAYAMGLIMTALVLVGCGTPRVGPATTTLDPMKDVGQVRSVKRTTVVTSNSTNITMVELDETPEASQKELRMTELKGQTKASVQEAKRPSLYVPTTSYGGGYGGYPSGSYYPTHNYNRGDMGHHPRGTVVTSSGEGGVNTVFSN
ncbi:hypothetical protein A2738_03160 [Candidatus Nomurabacteria bacterium RIFCSPHIGHO2_01_FULL_42_15]|uniref:Uncharacterized protein n=1 Tax=Candidatus Nomurabacteria bacterium RIFCSPHIGHO2_01_FULL_42_15 TaxID=1801742 RepID=A0A1F6VDV4_9BACT|nr:MAG: hypothetical protein A2738_03160 [Candidatus Nomurabacteria bacterium RIFCSPHIGHO2_01_FULL_42_15]OGI92945.1 MAG: hypothetical protein A3A99_00155 [Candidatus Nomurabacteria bacterium RIFCSPLOWO2_01_FULL_41_18]